MTYQAIWAWNAVEGWSFIGYAPSDRAVQMVRALQSYRTGGTVYWFGAYPTNYAVNKRTIWYGGWYRIQSHGTDGRWYFYGWYQGPFTRRALYAICALTSGSVWEAVAVNAGGDGYRSVCPGLAFYTETDHPVAVNQFSTVNAPVV